MKTRHRSRHGAVTLPTAVDWSDMSGSSSSSPPCATEVSSSQWPQTAMRDNNVGLSSRQAARPAREDQRTVRPRVAPSRTGASESQRAAPRQTDPPRRSECQAPVCQLFDGSDRPNSDSLQRHRSRAKSTDSASTPSALQVVDSCTAPRRLRSLLIRGGGTPDVHVSLITGGGQGPTPTIAEAGGSAHERTGERIAAVEVADRSGVAPELAGSKHAAPEQGSSGRPTKKSRVRSKM
jgi:hypothetical protein